LSIRTVRDLRRSQIIAAARQLVADGGLEALTIGQLERRLEFTRGVITYHFRDKDEIVAAVLDSAVDSIDEGTFAEVNASGSMPDKVRAVIATKVRGFLRERDARAILVSFWARIPSDPRVAAQNSRLFAAWRKQSCLLIKMGQAAGAFRDDVDPETAGALLVGIVLGIVLQASFESDLIDVDQLIDEGARTVLARITRPG
jgi:AcrR family transcriptional regulator